MVWIENFKVWWKSVERERAEKDYVDMLNSLSDEERANSIRDFIAENFSGQHIHHNPKRKKGTENGKLEV